MKMTNLKKIQSLFQDVPNLSGLILQSPELIAYLTGFQLLSLRARLDQITFLYLTKDSAALICPQFLASSFANGGWDQNILVYKGEMDPLKAARSLLRKIISDGSQTGMIGYEGAVVAASVISELTQDFGAERFVDLSSALQSVRQVRNQDEIKAIVRAAELTDHGIAGAIHHVATNQSRSEKFLSEDIRVHTLERGLHINGYNAISQAAGGKKASVLWPNYPAFGVGSDSQYEENQLIRLEMRGLYQGYWSDGARIMLKGELTDETASLFEGVAQLRRFICSLLKPGMAANQVYQKILQEADWLALPVLADYGFGNGIGTSLVEAPYLSKWDETILQVDMILNLKLAFEGPAGEILISRDLVLITPEGGEIKGWYQNWDTPYLTAFTF